MRILIVSNFYPPHIMGGYELHCALKAEGLAARGHTIHVLTSDYTAAGAGPDTARVRVDRRLPYVPDRRRWTTRRLWALERRSSAAARAALQLLRPDVIYVWNMWWMPLSTLLVLQRSGVPVVYQIDHNWMLEAVPHDPWLRRWQPGAATWRGRAHLLLRPVLRGLGTLVSFAQIRPETIICVSQFRRDEHIASPLAGALRPGGAHVIYNGIRPPTSVDRPARASGDPLRLLYVSRYLTPAKGLTTVLRALLELRAAGITAVTLDVYGEFHPDHGAYQAEVLTLAAQVPGAITWRGVLAHDDLQSIYPRYDALVFASNAPEGLPLTLVEALAHALPVIGTPAGGASEALPPAGSLTFRPDEAAELAQHILRLIHEPDLLPRLSAGARDFARQQFDLDQTVIQTEDVLQQVQR